MDKSLDPSKFLDDLLRDTERQDQLRCGGQSLRSSIRSDHIWIRRGTHWAKTPLEKGKGCCEDCRGHSDKILAFHIVWATLKHIESTNNNLIELHDTLGSQHTVWLHPGRKMTLRDMDAAIERKGTYTHFQDILGLNFLKPCYEVQGNWILYRRCHVDNKTSIHSLVEVYYSAR